MQASLTWLVPLALLIFFEVVADVFAKEYSLKDHWWLWVGAIAMYVIANACWLYSIKHGSGLARGAIIFSVGSAIGATLLGIFWYSEQVNTLQILGMVLGIISLGLIFWE